MINSDIKKNREISVKTLHNKHQIFMIFVGTSYNYGYVLNVRTFDHLIYVDYVTTSKKCCYHIKTCNSDFLLPHQNRQPCAVFHA